MADLERGRVVERLRLSADRRLDRRSAMPGIDAPETGGAVEQPPAVGGEGGHGLRCRAQARGLLEAPVVGEGHPIVFEVAPHVEGHIAPLPFVITGSTSTFRPVQAALVPKGAIVVWSEEIAPA